MVEKEDILATRAFLEKTQECLTDYAAVNETDERIDSLIPLIGMDTFFKIKKDLKGDMVERLAYGLHQYFRRNYMKIEEIQINEDEVEDTPDGEAGEEE